MSNHQLFVVIISALIGVVIILLFKVMQKSEDKKGECKKKKKKKFVSKSGSIYGDIPAVPRDEIIKTAGLFNKDTNPDKVNLGIGEYLDESGAPYVMKVVRKVEKLLVTKEYAPTFFDKLKTPASRRPKDGMIGKGYVMELGYDDYTYEARRILFGENCKAFKEGRIASAQGVGGCGSLTLAVRFLERFFSDSEFYTTSPCWPVYKMMVKSTFRKELNFIRYLKTDKVELDFENCIKNVKELEPRSIIIFQLCGNNPCGVDPTKEQWDILAEVCKKKNIMPLFDCAYQGCCQGIDEDAYGLRKFVSLGMEVVAIQSFSKNLCLYGERAGCVHVVCKTKELAENSKTQLKSCARGVYSFPPCNPGRLVMLVLGNPEWEKEFKLELKEIRDKINGNRRKLLEELKKIGSKRDWDFIMKQHGMFALLGISPKHVQYLQDKWHLYIVSNGRLCVARMFNDKIIKYTAKALADTWENCK